MPIARLRSLTPRMCSVFVAMTGSLGIGGHAKWRRRFAVLLVTGAEGRGRHRSFLLLFVDDSLNQLRQARHNHPFMRASYIYIR